jgi:hypothetical protein
MDLTKLCSLTIPYLSLYILHRELDRYPGFLPPNVTLRAEHQKETLR